MKIVKDKRVSRFSEGFKDGILEGLFDNISLGSEDEIVLGFIVGASVGSSKLFKDRKFDDTLVGNYLEGEGILYLVVE